MTAAPDRCPRCDRAECRMSDIDNRILDDKQRARIRSEHWADCYAATVDWRQRALDAEQERDELRARVDAALEACSEGVGDSAILDAIEAALRGGAS